jgi:hypothetical protein
MSNTIITNDMIAKEALVILENSLMFSGLIYKGYSDEWAGTAYKKGDTVRVRRPATFTAAEFTSEISIQNVTEQTVSLTLEKHFDTSLTLSAKDRALNLRDFSEQILQPAVISIADAVNIYALGKYTKVPYFYDAGTSTPALPTTIGGLANLGAVLDGNKVPLTNRNAVLTPTAKATLLALEAFHRADARGDAGTALRDGSMGRVLGFDWYMDQQVRTHTAGTFSAGTPAVNGAVLAGATTMNIDGGAGTETLKAGDLFTVADVAGQYVVTADKTATAGAVTGVTFFPAAPVGGFPNDKAITVKKSHKANLAFHPNAFALAFAPLEAPAGGAAGQVINYKGISIRIVQGYNQTTKKDIISFDCLVGADAIQPELAARLLEAV